MSLIHIVLVGPENISLPCDCARVFIQFVIDKTGAVTKVKVLRGVDPALDAEALRVVKAMPKWKPGSQRGKAVPVTYQVPINFKLN